MEYKKLGTHTVFGNMDFYNCDCMKLLKQTPDKYYNIAITDPPYFSDYAKLTCPGNAISTTGVKRHRFESTHWEIPDKRYFDELIRVSKNQIIWGINYYNIKNLGSGRIIWDKVNDDSSFSKAEIAYCSLHKSVQMVRCMWNGMLQGNMKEKEVRIHSTQKPVALYRWLLKHYAKEDDHILDTHGGSMSIAIACHQMGFKATICELDKKYFNSAMQRIEKETRQEKLFNY